MEKCRFLEIYSDLVMLCGTGRLNKDLKWHMVKCAALTTANEEKKRIFALTQNPIKNTLLI